MSNNSCLIAVSSEYLKKNNSRVKVKKVLIDANDIDQTALLTRLIRTMLAANLAKVIKVLNDEEILECILTKEKFSASFFRKLFVCYVAVR